MSMRLWRTTKFSDSIAVFAAAAAAGGGYAPAQLALANVPNAALEDMLDAAEQAAIQQHDKEARERASGDDDGQRGPGPLRFDRLYRGGNLVAVAYGGGRSRAICFVNDCGECRIAVECDAEDSLGSPLFAARVAAVEGILGEGILSDAHSPFRR